MDEIPILRRFNHEEVQRLLKLALVRMHRDVPIEFDPDFDVQDGVKLVAWSCNDFCIAETVISKHLGPGLGDTRKVIGYLVQLVHHIPGRFNPYDGGTPPETDVVNIHVADNPREAIKEAFMAQVSKDIDIMWEDDQMEAPRRTH